MSVGSVAMSETVVRPLHLSVEQYHRMSEAGLFEDFARVELLDGEVLVIHQIGPRHASCVDRLNALFAPLWERAVLRVQNPLSLADDSEPIPDFLLVRRRPGGYADVHPEPADVHLAVEVYDTTHAIDRERKSARYAARGIREYWVVDLVADTVEVRRRPDGERWGDVHLARAGETISPVDFPDLPVEVAALLPPRAEP